MLENGHCLIVAAAVDEVLRRLLEPEDDESQEEDEQRYGAQCEQCVTPTHVASFRTAPLARRHSIAGRECAFSEAEIRLAGVFGDESVCDRGADHHSDGLKDRKEREQEALALWDELEADGGIDRYVATDTKADECGDHEEGIIRVATSKSKSKCGADEAG